MAAFSWIAVAGGVLLSSWLLIYFVDHHMRCNQADIKQLCQSFSLGNTTGALCTDLCESHSMNIKECLTTAPEEKVFLAEWNGREAVLKLASNWFRQFSELNPQDKLARNHTEFHWSQISDIVRSMFGNCVHCSLLTEKLLDFADVDNDGLLTVFEIKTMVALLNQQEPKMLMMLNGSKYSLDFFGYCGGLYAVEKLSHVLTAIQPQRVFTFSVMPQELQEVEDLISRNIVKPIASLAILNKLYRYFEQFWYCYMVTYFQQDNPNSQEIFHLVYSFLDLITDISLANHIGVLQSCDSHIENFGFSTTSSLKLMDLDFVFPRVYLENILSSKKCLSHKDCKVGLLDQCASRCNYTSGFCTTQLMSQDLQNICRMVFSQILQRFKMRCYSDKRQSAYAKLEEVMSFCSKLPVTHSYEALRNNIEAVRTKFQALDSGTL